MFETKDMDEDLNSSLEYTPIWVLASVLSTIIVMSLLVERALNRLGKFLAQKNQDALYEVLHKLKEELMFLGFVSLLLTVTQNFITEICIPTQLASHMLPCKRHNVSSNEVETNNNGEYQALINRRQLLSEESSSDHCEQKGMVQFLSLEALHHLHIFMFVLAIAHVIFCASTVVFGWARIRQWNKWEDSAFREMSSQHHQDFVRLATGYWGEGAAVSWMISFFKQFYGSVTKSDYIALRQRFIEEHCPGNPRFDFYKYIKSTLEVDFKKVVGISWYMWLFVVVFLLINLEGWHTYFWLGFQPLILLLLVGAKLEHIVTHLAHESYEGRFLEDYPRGRPSDTYFWFHRPLLVLELIHFISFQNSFEIAFFFWIWSTYGFDSCIMENLAYIIPRLVIGVIVQVLCSYSTLPVYTIATQMGSRFAPGMFEKMIQSSIMSWSAQRSRIAGHPSEKRRTLTHNMAKEVSNDIAEQVIMTEGTTSIIELVQPSSSSS
ncbi:MLO-like protein [Quillaja saponaria]|uniref:MLO-like protein n=1 Tax=Quillaja saponaria TaxID=32244 RepID=A0AAD7P8X6_QUISA|nr:MLO-like protein [Quillaja saponaria]